MEADDAELLMRINQILDEHIRPFLDQDGGGLDVVKLKEFTLTVRYKGACGGPSSSTGTLSRSTTCCRATWTTACWSSRSTPIAALAARRAGASAAVRSAAGRGGGRYNSPPSTIRRIRPRAVHAEPLHP